MRRFDEKVVLVTGAASGIGRACVERMAGEGARVACVDVQSEAVEETARLACLSKPDTAPLADQDLQALRAAFAASW